MIATEFSTYIDSRMCRNS